MMRYFMKAGGHHPVSMCSALCLLQGRPTGLRGLVPAQPASATERACSVSGYAPPPPPCSSRAPEAFWMLPHCLTSVSSWSQVLMTQQLNLSVQPDCLSQILTATTVIPVVWTYHSTPTDTGIQILSRCSSSLYKMS